MILPSLVGGIGALAIALASLLGAQSGVMKSYFSVVNEDLARAAHLGLALHLLLFLLVGAGWVAMAREAALRRAVQLGIAAPTAVATLFNVTTPSPTAFPPFDKLRPPEEQAVCNLNAFDAFLAGLYATALPSDLTNCYVARRDTAALDAPAKLSRTLASPAGLSVSDFVASRINADPILKTEVVPTLLDSIKPAETPNADEVNKTVARTLALSGGWSGTPDQVAGIEALKSSTPYQNDVNFRFWTDQALATRLPSPTK